PDSRRTRRCPCDAACPTSASCRTGGPPSAGQTPRRRTRARSAARSRGAGGLLDERLDPESRRWATSTRLWTASDVKVFIAGAPAAWLAGAEARFAIVETATGDCAGSLGLRMTVPAFRIAEIGYGLRAGWRGRGLATRSVRLGGGRGVPPGGGGRAGMG